MAIGPGKYDDLCTLVREKAEAAGAVIIVLGGNKGEGFSAQVPPVELFNLARVLRYMADEIERSVEGKA